MSTRNRSIDIEAIRSWYLNEDSVELTAHQRQKQSRLLMISSLMSVGKPNFYIVRILKKNYGLSTASIYRDIRDSISLYGDLRKAEKEGLRWILYDLAMATYQRAIVSGNLQQENAALANLIKITGVDKEDSEMPDFEKLKPSLNIVVMDPEIESKVKDMLMAGPLDLEKLRIHHENKQVIDVEHEEVDRTTGAAE